MNIADQLPGIFAALMTAGVLSLVAYMMPSVRWSRQLAREVEILGGLPEGAEREAWEKRVVEHAERLRLFQDVMPRRHKILPWVPVTMFVTATVLAILDPRQLDAVVAEGPIMIGISAMAILSVGLFIVTAVLGLSTSGKTAKEEYERRHRRLAAEDSPPSPPAEPGT